MCSTHVTGHSERDEINKLRRTPEAQRIILAGQLVNAYHDPRTPQNYRTIAEDLMRALAEDVSASVRAAFSDLIKNSDSIPAYLALKLAQDIDEVAEPILECSELLSEENIIGIIGASVRSDRKLVAIASRRVVTRRVSSALIETRNGAAAAALMRNPQADVEDEGYEIVLEVFGNDPSLVKEVLMREKLPANLVSSLSEKISAAMFSAVCSKAPELAEKFRPLLARSETAAALKTLGLQAPALDYDRFMKKIQSIGAPEELVPLMALCLGKTNLFETCMAHAMGVSVANVRALLADPSGKGFRAAYSKSGMPLRLLKVTGALLDIVRKHEAEGQGDLDKVDVTFTNRLIEQLAAITIAGDTEQEENIQYVSKIILRCHAIFAHL